MVPFCVNIDSVQDVTSTMAILVLSPKIMTFHSTQAQHKENIMPWTKYHTLRIHVFVLGNGINIYLTILHKSVWISLAQLFTNVVHKITVTM